MSVKVKVHTGAVRALLNSGGVMAELQKHSDAAAARCNALVEWHAPMNAPAYIAIVDNAPYTAIGKVVINTGLGCDGNAALYYEAKYKCLENGSGW